MASPQSLETCAEKKPNTVAKEAKVVKRLKQAQWLRAAILGSSDGLLSTATLMLGIGAAKEDQQTMILSGIAGALAGACSMAVGEFVSVSTQRDIEQAAMSKCGSESDNAGGDVDIIKIQISTNTTSSTTGNQAAHKISPELSTFPSSDPEVPQGISPGQQSFYGHYPVKSPVMRAIAEDGRANMQESTDHVSSRVNSLPNPYKAGAASALAFLCGSLIPLLAAIIIAAHSARIIIIVAVTSIALALTGGVGASFGGSKPLLPAARVVFGGWISMAITYGLLRSFNHDPDSHDAD